MNDIVNLWRKYALRRNREMTALLERYKFPAKFEEAIQKAVEKRHQLQKEAVAAGDPDRKYLEDATLPEDDALQKCPECKFPYVDLPNENIERKKRNKEKIDKWIRDKNYYKECKNKKPPINCIINNKLITKEPQCHKLEPIILQCHSFQMMCTGPNQGTCKM